jgi:hypothetical protein
MNCIERRRNNAAMFDKMTQILSIVTGGKLTKAALMTLAEKVAAQKQVKIDREAKRMKDCLICWFCENTGDQDSLSSQATDEGNNKESAPPDFPAASIDEFDTSACFRDDDFFWSVDIEKET